MATGTYTLLIAVEEAVEREVGSLGTVRFGAGCCAYTGSAFGSGGLQRVERHRELARGDRTVRHWHVDHLLTAPGVEIAEVFVAEGEDRECATARRLPGTRVDGFGASDCTCGSHLAVAPREELRAALERRY